MMNNNNNKNTPSISADDTKDFVLYVYKGEQNSAEALKLLNQNPSFSRRCAVKNIATLPDIPAFLQGVPTLFIKSTKLICCGTKALQAIEEQQKIELKPMGMRQKSNYTPAPVKEDNLKKFTTEKVTDAALQRFMERRQ